jgi:hypothetical protein
MFLNNKQNTLLLSKTGQPLAKKKKKKGQAHGKSWLVCIHGHV